MVKKILLCCLYLVLISLMIYSMCMIYDYSKLIVSVYENCLENDGKFDDVEKLHFFSAFGRGIEILEFVVPTLIICFITTVTLFVLTVVRHTPTPYFVKYTYEQYKQQRELKKAEKAKLKAQKQAEKIAILQEKLNKLGKME